MRRLLQNVLLVCIAYLTGFWPTPVRAQTPAVCGCVFVRDQQPRNVRVWFAGERRSVAAVPNMVVHTGDLLVVRRPVSGTLVCDNVAGTVGLRSAPRNQPVPCLQKPPEGILIGRNGRSIDSRTMAAGTELGFPVVLSPRLTKLLDPHPVLRWTTVGDAVSYKVTVRGGEGSWSITVPARPGSQTQEIVYPRQCAPDQKSDCAPPLRAGESYKLVVEANGRNSEEEDLPDLGFKLLTEEDAQKVRSKAEEINRLALAVSLKTRMLASLYANNGLNADAITTLESVPGSQPDPEAVRLLGDLYLKLKLTRRAEALYLNLLKPELVAQDIPAGRAITHQTLGEIYEALGNTQEAIKYYVEAVKIFRSLKDRKSIRRIKRRLAVLRRP